MPSSISLPLGNVISKILSLFASNAGDYRRSETINVLDRYRIPWGRSWFMLPNPAYGSWERQFYDRGEALSDEERIRMKMKRLNTWR